MVNKYILIIIITIIIIAIIIPYRGKHSSKKISNKTSSLFPEQFSTLLKVLLLSTSIQILNTVIKQ